MSNTAAAASPSAWPHTPPCRFCRKPLNRTFVDLGMSPLCQTVITPAQLNQMEPFYPLHAYVCEHCFLVQIEEFVAPADIFTEYAYFSSYSDSWVEHARKYAVARKEELNLGPQSLVAEIASNDGYLLQHFVKMGVPVLGIEPAANVGVVAREKGVRTETEFFGVETAKKLSAKYGQADLLLGNNVLAHVPNLHDFVGGMKVMLKAGGTITMEFPHLWQLMDQNQYDTIYHEHFSYLAFFVVEKVFAHHGLRLFHVEELQSHGGSLRIFGCHQDDPRPTRETAIKLREFELSKGLNSLATYQAFEARVHENKRQTLDFLIRARREGKRVVGYGAPGKGNTLLNYCGIRTDFLELTVDRNPYKQGKFTPGTRIPILDPAVIDQVRPDYIFILPWNLSKEITSSMAHVRQWGCRFVVPIPDLRVLD